MIPSPRRKRQNEDALGDDLEEDNDYKFSGRFGDGDDHKVLDWKDEDVQELKSLMRPAGVLDLLAHHYNWKSTHPFEYHTKDYEYPEEEEGSRLNSVKFHRGIMGVSYIEAFPTSLHIDDRYQDVTYYNTASYFSLTEDGSVVIGDWLRLSDHNDRWADSTRSRWRRDAYVRCSSSDPGSGSNRSGDE